MAGAFLVACGLANLIGWWTDIGALRGMLPGTHGLAPTIGVGFLLAGASLWCLRSSEVPTLQHRIGMGLGVLVVVLGAVSALERVIQWNSGLDLLFFHNSVLREFSASATPGRMALSAAVSFLLEGLALLLFDVRGRRRAPPSEFLATVVFFLAFLALIGYAYGVKELYSLSQAAAGMSVLTALSFVTLSVGIFFARPDRGFAVLIAGDNASGLLTRRLLPAAIIVPVALGWFWLEAMRTTMLEQDIAIALFVLAIIGVFVTLVARSASVVRTTDAQRETLLESEQRARTDAEAANLAKSQFLASISHELRTPLNAISGYAELLELGIRGPVNDEQREDLQRIRRSQQHLLSLINDILNFARIETGHLEYRLASTPLDEILRDAAALTEPQMRAKGIVFTYHPCDAGVSVMADRDKLRQVVLNLLSNATKFTEREGQVTLSCSSRPESASVQVADTGRGIPGERLDDIFEPFVQLERTLTRNVEGTGLGLAISRDLARGMGGELSVESTVGVGSVFTVRLKRETGVP